MADIQTQYDRLREKLITLRDIGEGIYRGTTPRSNLVRNIGVAVGVLAFAKGYGDEILASFGNDFVETALQPLGLAEDIHFTTNESGLFESSSQLIGAATVSLVVGETALSAMQPNS